VPNGEKASVIPLTVSFSEPMFLAGVAEENAFTLNYGFWLQLSGKQKEKAKLPWGPQNPQTLNRYAYVMNNPLRYVDPTGHDHDEAGDEVMGYEFLYWDVDGHRVFKIWWHEYEAIIVEKDTAIPLLADFKEAVRVRSEILARLPLVSMMQNGSGAGVAGSVMTAYASCPAAMTGAGTVACVGSIIVLGASEVVWFASSYLLELDKQTVREAEVHAGQLLVDFQLRLNVNVYIR